MSFSAMDHLQINDRRRLEKQSRYRNVHKHYEPTDKNKKEKT